MESEEVICEYCKNKLKNIMMLNKHQRVSKYCLVIQGKIEDKKKNRASDKEQKEREREKERERIRKEKEEEKDRIEKEKEEKRENRHRCLYCKVKFTTRTNLCGHLDICLEKYKKIIEEKEKIIEENKIKKKKEKENTSIILPTIGDLHIENSALSTQIEELRANTAHAPIAITPPCYTNNNCSYKPLILNDVTIEVDPVTFMINATQMCQAAGKEYYDYAKNAKSKSYKKNLESKPIFFGLDLIKSNRGGNHSGTMVHRLIAYDLASWCSAEVAVQFALWIDELCIENAALSTQIEELQTNAALVPIAIAPPSAHLPNVNGARKPLVLNGVTIEVDPDTFMVNATMMCKAAGRLFGDYHRQKKTDEYLSATSLDIGIPISNLVQRNQSGRGTSQDTSVHFLVALHLAHWLSPSFAVQVSLWVKSLDRSAAAPRVEEHNDLLINENKRLNSTNNKLEKENKKIKETTPIIGVLNNMTCTNTNGADLVEAASYGGEIIEFVLKLSNGADFIIPVRRDGYVNVTKICQAAGKRLQHYKDRAENKHFLDRFVALTRIQANAIFEVIQGGNLANVEQGTFAHPDIAIHIAQWCSADFSIQVSRWVRQLMTTGSVELGNEMRTNQLDNEWKKKIEDLTGSIDEEKEKYIIESNRCKDLELRINLIEEDKIKKEENEKKKIIDDLNTTISVFSTETKSKLNFNEEKEVIYLGYIGNFLFKYGQSSNFKDRLGTHEKSTSYEKFELVKVFACKNPVVSERKVREWVRKTKLEYEYKPEGEAARGQREIIKIESKEMLERVCKAMHKYSNFNINKMPGSEVEIKRIEAEIDIKKIEADKEVNIKKTEAEIKRIEAETEIEIKRMNLLSEGKINFDQYIQLKK